MSYRILADAVLVIHFAFVLFVVFGGILVMWKPALAWIHLPAMMWGVAISVFGWICPLTPLENWLREASGMPGYQRGFIEHYILFVLYPQGLTRQVQIALGVLLLIGNLALYGYVFRVRARR